MISSPGVGSGVDINNLVAQLVDAERRPATLRFARTESGLQADISAFGQIKGALSSLQDALTALKTSSAFEARTASSSDTTVLSATAGSTAGPGAYGLEVTSLATAHKLTSVGLTSAAATLGSGTLTITSGTKSANVAISSSAATVSDVRNGINAVTATTGVSATTLTVDDGNGGSLTKLVLSTADTGVVNAIKITAVDDDGNNTDTAGLSRLVFDPTPGSGVTNLTETQAPGDARFKIDGQSVTRASNTVSDAISGVTLSLLSASPGKTVTVSVQRDPAATRANVQKFVDRFNALQSVLADLTKFDAATDTKGPLLGDATARGVSNQLRRILTTPVPAAGAAFDTLSEVGIRAAADGTLTFDTAVFDAALATNSAAVSSLFDSTNGVAAQLDTQITGLLGSSGTIESRLDGLNNRLDDLNDQRAVLDRRLGARQTRLLRQFQAMDTIVAQLQSTSSFLTQQFAALQGLSGGRSG